jgi:hypothetical protein
VALKLERELHIVISVLTSSGRKSTYPKKEPTGVLTAETI